MTVSLSSDFLYPPHQQAALAEVLGMDGRSCSYHSIESVYGHDGFLVEHTKLAPLLEEFFEKVAIES